MSHTKFQKIAAITSLCIRKVAACMATAFNEAGFYGNVMHYCDSTGNYYYSITLIELVDDCLCNKKK